MSEERKIDDAELADVSGAGGGGISELDDGGPGGSGGGSGSGLKEDGENTTDPVDDPFSTPQGPQTPGGNPPITNLE